MRVLVAALLCAFVATACTDGGTDTGRRGAGDVGKVAVVASFYPLAYAATEVGGPRVSVTNLTPVGSEPHEFEPNPRQVERLEDADLVLYLGTRLQPAVAEVAGGLGRRAVDLLRVARPEGGDPHVWLDPERMGAVVRAIEAALARVDAAGRATYAANSARLQAELAQLAADYDAGLANCERNVMIVPHASFEYMAAPHGLEQEPIAGTSPEAEPDPARMARLLELVKDAGVTTIFRDPLEPGDAAETVARRAGVTTAVLSTIEGLTTEDRSQGQDYLSLMRRNLATLREALDCP